MRANSIISKSSCLAWLLLLLGNQGYAGERINIFVSIPPQKYLVERIGGEYVAVSVMVGPGRSPETYEPLPKQMALLNQAQLYFCIGVPFEKIWMDTIRSVNSRMRVIDCCEEIAVRYHNDHTNNLVDHHVWTSPKNAQYLARLIKDALINENPERQAFYERNYQQLAGDLEVLDAEISAALRGRRTSYIIVSHPSWGYFAGDYGIEQVSLESFGKEKGARGIAGLIDLARRERIETVFLQKQSKTAAVTALAKELNARIIEIDPLAEDYIGNLRLVAKYIAEATG